MSRLLRAVKRQLQRPRGAERFVQLIVGAGIALVAGLWVLELAAAWSALWLFGVGLMVLGLGGLTHGVWSQLEY